MTPPAHRKKIRALEAALSRQQEKLAALKRHAPRFAPLADGVDGWYPQYRS